MVKLEVAKDVPAVGLISPSNSKNKLSMQATVFVTSTCTMYEETACGTGALALALVESFNFKQNAYSREIFQPSGYPIKVEICSTISSNGVVLHEYSVAGVVKIIGLLNLE